MKRRAGSVGLIALAGMMVGCGGGAPSIRPSPTPTAAAATSTAAAATPTTAAATAAAEPTPQASFRGLRMGTLAAGTYRTNFFEPQLLITLPDGWTQFFADEVDEIAMGGPGAELALTRPPQVRDPAAGPIDTPDDLLAWLVAHPQLGASEPVAVQIDGIDSHYVDFNATNEVRVFAFPSGDFRIGAGSRQRMYVIPLDGVDVAVTVGAPESGDLATALAAAQPIVESLVVGE